MVVGQGMPLAVFWAHSAGWAACFLLYAYLGALPVLRCTPATAAHAAPAGPSSSPSPGRQPADLCAFRASSADLAAAAAAEHECPGGCWHLGPAAGADAAGCAGAGSEQVRGWEAGRQAGCQYVACGQVGGAARPWAQHALPDALGAGQHATGRTRGAAQCTHGLEIKRQLSTTPLLPENYAGP